MAISRERLEKLIEQEATIYYDNTLYIEKKILTPNKYECDSGYLWGLSHSKHTVGYDLEDLYETQKEAEWHLKYRATRTEELNLPMWEEFFNSGKSIVFRDAYGDIQELKQYNREIYINEQYCGYLTEENYIKACDLCVKLFKGEEE